MIMCDLALCMSGMIVVLPLQINHYQVNAIDLFAILVSAESELSGARPMPDPAWSVQWSGLCARPMPDQADLSKPKFFNLVDAMVYAA